MHNVDRRTLEKVEVEVARAFTDSKTHRLYSVGVWPVTLEEAERFAKEGRLKGVEPKKIGNPNSGDKEPSKSKPETGNAIQGIPEDFPERELLIENGFETMDDLRVSDLKEKLLAIDGIGPAKLNKIGLALSE